MTVKNLHRASQLSEQGPRVHAARSAAAADGPGALTCTLRSQGTAGRRTQVGEFGERLGQREVGRMPSRMSESQAPRLLDQEPGSRDRDGGGPGPGTSCGDGPAGDSSPRRQGMLLDTRFSERRKRLQGFFSLNQVDRTCLLQVGRTPQPRPPAPLSEGSPQRLAAPARVERMQKRPGNLGNLLFFIFFFILLSASCTYDKCTHF